MTIFPPISGSHTSLLQQTAKRGKKKKKATSGREIKRRGGTEGTAGLLPPRAGLLSLVPKGEAAQAHHGGQHEHDGVEAQPGEVDPDLLPVVLPEGQTGSWLYSWKPLSSPVMLVTRY